MKISCGIDLVEDKRFDTLMTDTSFIDKCLQPSEREIIEKLPTIFSLKEATIKALELPPDSWLEIEVTYCESGKTKIELSDSIKPSNLVSIDSSVSHEAGITVAQVFLLLE